MRPITRRLLKICLLSSAIVYIITLDKNTKNLVEGVFFYLSIVVIISIIADSGERFLRVK